MPQLPPCTRGRRGCRKNAKNAKNAKTPGGSELLLQPPPGDRAAVGHAASRPARVTPVGCRAATRTFLTVPPEVCCHDRYNDLPRTPEGRRFLRLSTARRSRS